MSDIPKSTFPFLIKGSKGNACGDIGKNSENSNNGSNMFHQTEVCGD